MTHLPSPARQPARWRAAAIAFIAAVAAAAAAPAPAQAAACDTFRVTDSLGLLWDFDNSNDGYVDDGTGDAYDSFGYFGVNGIDYWPDDTSTCSTDENDREFVYSADEEAVYGPDIVLTRKVYVPATGTAFARWLNIIENTGATPQTVDVEFHGELGSDSDTVVRASADGNQTADAGEAWVATDDDVNGDPPIAHVADGSRAAGREVANEGWDLDPTGDDTISVTYNNLTIPAGERVILMHFEAQRYKQADAAAAAEQISAGTEGIFAQLTDEERADIVNWSTADIDGDGVGYKTDNCEFAANADQKNTDGDAAGDACDDDIDGDGYSNELEAAIGTDPAKADTDGDGVRDDKDRCPVTAGDQADGCAGNDAPPAVAITSPANGTKVDPGKGTTITATASDDKGVASVVFVDDGKVVGTDTTAPYTLDYKPKGEDVGRNTLAAIAVDGAGQTATAFLQLVSDRFKADGLTAKTSPKSDGSLPYRFTTRGKLDLPEGLTSAEACKGKVSVQIKAGKKTVSNRRAKLRGDCTYRSAVTFSLPSRLNPSKLKVVTRFRGNAVLKAQKAKTRTVKAG